MQKVTLNVSSHFGINIYIQVFQYRKTGREEEK